jgi:hypothetical protein
VSAEMQQVPAENASFCSQLLLCFPYVCPEPVLVKRSFLVALLNGAPKKVKTSYAPAMNSIDPDQQSFPMHTPACAGCCCPAPGVAAPGASFCTW